MAVVVCKKKKAASRLGFPKDACGFWSLNNCGCDLQKRKKKKPHPAWVFLRKMPEKQSILFAWPYQPSFIQPSYAAMPAFI